MSGFRLSVDAAGPEFICEGPPALALVREGDILTVDGEKSEVERVRTGGDERVVVAELQDGRTVYRNTSGKVKVGLCNVEAVLELDDPQELPDRLANRLRCEEDLITPYVYMWFKAPPAISPIEGPDTKLVYKGTEDKSLNVYEWKGYLFSWVGTKKEGTGELHRSMDDLREYVRRETKTERVTCPKDKLQILEQIDLRNHILTHSI